MSIFATPEPTWNAMLVALDEDPPDVDWVFKLVIQCRDHTRLALQSEGNPEVLGGPALTEWNRDPGARSPRRTDSLEKATWRTSKDIPGGPSGPSGAYQPWHVLLGALIGNEFEDARQISPPWTRSLYSEKPWVMSAGSNMTDHQIRTTTPDWLSERGVYVSDRDLADN